MQWVQPVVSVIVPMLNAGDQIERLLTSLLDQDFDRPWELILVDNGSDDDSAAVAEGALRRGNPPTLVRWEIASASPRGYATPRNAGAELARASRFAFCDADDAVDRAWLTAMVQALEVHALVASRKLGTPDVAARNPDDVLSDQDRLPTQLGLPIAHATGLGCSRELFESLGGFDPYFDGGGEDADFSVRAQLQCGVKPVLALDAIYWAARPPQPSRSFRKGFRDGRSRVRLYARHLGQHSEPPSGPMATMHGCGRLVRRLPRMRDPDRRPAIARSAGFLAGRVVGSVRYRVRYF